MYLPTSFLIPSQYSAANVTYLNAYTGGGSGDDHLANIYAAVARWISHAFAAVVAWLKTAFAAVAAWVHDTLPVVIAWFHDTLPIVTQPVKDHRHATLIISALIFLGPQIILLPLLILQGVFLLLLTVLGFGAGGVVGGSPAARYQSLCYGGNTPGSSIFSIFQSLGAKYQTVTLGHWVLAIVRLVAGVMFVYVVIGMIWLW
ncbi:hypothetical protein B0H17DRAFT_1193502 [Mycena rosella]|uniref:Uncharacterized protein n=1 Tax=Mycena rosella TaxID=1033263 RepID=A0AAD7GTL1_MYCRO|nr:hypothetical protein B0H17DRAFT_1193502 [Mycena rosella]